MTQLKTKHDDSVSLAGFYFGILGALLSAAGIALSVYALYSGERSLWLSLSGWVSAILIGTFLTKLCLRLLYMNSSMHIEASEGIRLARSEAKKSIQKIMELNEKISALEYANNRLNEINSFIVSASAIPQAKAKAKARRPVSGATHSSSNIQSKAQNLENEEVTDDI